MKMSSDDFIKKLNSLKGESYTSVLLYGLNGGLIDFIANDITEYFEKESSVIIKMYDSEIEKSSEELYKEIFNMSLFGEHKLIIIKGASNKITANIKDIMDRASSDGVDLKSQCFLLLLSDNLDSKSQLRGYYEKEKSLLSVPCYEDNSKTTSSTIMSFFGKHDIKYNSSLISDISSFASKDRGILLNDLSTFFLYLGDRKEFNQEDVVNFFYDSTVAAIDELVDAIFDGSIRKSHTTFSKLISSDIQMVTIIRSIISHLFSIRSGKEAMMTKGLKSDEVVKFARVFFKRAASYKRHLDMPLERLDNILHKLANLEIKIKQYSAHESMCLALFSQAITSMSNISRTGR